MGGEAGMGRLLLSNSLLKNASKDTSHSPHAGQLSNKMQKKEYGAKHLYKNICLLYPILLNIASFYGATVVKSVKDVRFERSNPPRQLR